MKLIGWSTALLVAGAAFISGAAPRQEPPAEGRASEKIAVFPDAGVPGRHHEHLHRMIGDWDFAVSMRSGPHEPAIEFEGVVTRSWVLDERYVREQVNAESPMGAFRGIGFIGYNDMDGHYEMVWMSNLATAIGFETGTFDETTNIMTFRSANRDPESGRLVHARGEFDLSRADRQTFKAYAVAPDGTEHVSFEGTFERRR